MAKRTIQPFARFRGLFLFLLLEVISFILVINLNTKHSQIYLSTANAVTGSAYDSYDAIEDYFSLKDQIAELQVENALLRNRLNIAKYENVSAMDTTNVDSLKQKFTFIPARVISNFYANSNNILTINKGTDHGVKADMGVINSKGIIGITRQASRHYATVMSLYHKQTRISVSIKRTGAFGSLEWSASTSEPELMELKAIPKHEDVKLGDTLITSGYGHHFPRGIKIGVIESKKLPSGSNFFTLKVNLLNDLKKLQGVYVINNIMRDEVTQLEQSSE